MLAPNMFRAEFFASPLASHAGSINLFIMKGKREHIRPFETK